MADTNIVENQATSYKISSLYLKPAGEEGQDVQGTNIPLATDIDNVFLEFPYKTTSIDASTEDITSLKSLRDILFGTYQAQQGDDPAPYQVGYLMPFDVNETSFIQYLIDTQKEWMDNFFGIYSPDEEQLPNKEDGSPLGYYFNLGDVEKYCLIPALGEDGNTIYRKVTETEAEEICNKITNRSLAQLLLTAENYWALLPEENYHSDIATISIARQEDIKSLFDDWNDSASPELSSETGG